MAKEYLWKDLGKISGPGKYRANGFGLVEVTEGDIKDAAKLGGNILLELIDVDTANSRIAEFRIGSFTPVGNDYKKPLF